MVSLQELSQRLLATNGGYPPALTIGLTIFLPTLYILNLLTGLNSHIALHADSLFTFDLNRVSLYPLGHVSIFHVLLNVISLITPLSKFERSHGTVYTGVILNLFAVFVAVPYCILGYYLWPNNSVIGASGWVFSFVSYYAYQESLIQPTIRLTPTFTFPTVYSPLISVFVIALIIPGSSLIGHLFGCGVGYAYALKYMDILVPPSKVIEWIEEKLEKLIDLIPSMFKYYKEIDAKHLRGELQYVSVWQPQFVNADGSLDTTDSTFAGEGRTLGTV